MTRAGQPEKCWNCGADRNGRISEKRGKRVAQTRDLLKELDNEKFKCVDGIMKWHPCEKCCREGDVLLEYRTSALKHIQGVLLDNGVVSTKAQAAIAAQALIDKVDLGG